MSGAYHRLENNRDDSMPDLQEAIRARNQIKRSQSSMRLLRSGYLGLWHLGVDRPGVSMAEAMTTE